MNKKLPLFWKLFIATFSLSAFTFGGGYVIVPLMRKKFVDSLHWIEEKEMLDLTAIAQSAPGPIAVNASILVGYRVAGIPGALVAVFGTILPPLIILSVISLFYVWFRSNRWVSALLRGMQAGVAAVIVDVTLSMGMDVARQKNVLTIVIMLTAFLLTYFLNVNVVYIILSCGVLGFTVTLWKSRKMKGEGKR